MRTFIRSIALFELQQQTDHERAFVAKLFGIVAAGLQRNMEILFDARAPFCGTSAAMLLQIRAYV